MTAQRRLAIPGALLLALVAVILGLPGREAVAADAAAQSGWVDGYNSRVRLLAGTDTAAGGRRVVAGVEIETKSDWKTYWRNPGDAGVPPAFDWSKSVNVATADVRYPAPLRLVDKSGVTIGYLGGVVFPVMVTPTDPAKPVTLRLTIDYGVCKDICVPAQAELSLDIATTEAGPMPTPLVAALDRLPSQRGQERPGDPVVKGVTVDLAAASPHLALEVLPPPGVAADAIDAFLVAEDGGFVPLPGRASALTKGALRLVVDLSKDVDLKDLRGKSIHVTITAPDGASDAVIAIK